MTRKRENSARTKTAVVGGCFAAYVAGFVVGWAASHASSFSLAFRLVIIILFPSSSSFGTKRSSYRLLTDDTRPTSFLNQSNSRFLGTYLASKGVIDLAGVLWERRVCACVCGRSPPDLFFLLEL